MAVADSTERKYALTRIKAGDYLLPSNDAKTIWRLLKYEDGPSHGITDWDRDKTFWGVWRWKGTLDIVDIEDWDRWEMVSDFLTSRTQAIREALSRN